MSPVLNPVGVDGAPGSNPRGAWSPVSTYGYRDVVVRRTGTSGVAGGSFLALTNGLNTDPLVDTTNWLQLAADGATGATGAPGSSGGAPLAPAYDGAHAAPANDQRLLSAVPAVQNFLTWTHDPMQITQNTGVSGTLYLAKLWLPQPLTITNLHMILNTNGTTYTYWAMGIYSTTGATLNLLASSADLHTTVVTGFNTFPLTAPYAWAGGAGATIYVGVLGVFASAFFAAMNNNGYANFNCSAGAGLRNGRITGLASLPATITASSIGGPNLLPWMAMS